MIDVPSLAAIQPYFHIVIAALLPALVALIAGAIRQDGLPEAVNEVISYAVVVAVALLQALADGKLGGSGLADFMIVAGYSQAALHSPLLQKLQQYLQVNVFAVLKGTPPDSTPVASQSSAVDTAQAELVFDLLKRNAPALAQLVSVELAKQFQVGAPAASPPPLINNTLGVASVANHVDELDTRGVPVPGPFPSPRAG